MRVRVGDVALWFDVEGAELVVNGSAMGQRPTLLLLHGGRTPDLGGGWPDVIEPQARALAG